MVTVDVPAERYVHSLPLNTASRFLEQCQSQHWRFDRKPDHRGLESREPVGLTPAGFIALSGGLGEAKTRLFLSNRGYREFSKGTLKSRPRRRPGENISTFRAHCTGSLASSPLDVADEGLPDDLGEHQVADWVAIERLRKALWDAMEADEAKQVENDEKGVAAADTPGGPPGSDVG
jgi:hypothetical protein